MHEHEEQNECGCDQLQSQSAHGQEVSQVVHDCQSHDGDGGRVGCPEGDPAAQECQGAGTCFTEVNVLTAIFGICGCQFCVAEVCGDLEQAADNEGQNQEQGAACCVGNVSQGGENTGADCGADAQGDNRTQTQFSTEIVGVGHEMSLLSLLCAAAVHTGHNVSIFYFLADTSAVSGVFYHNSSVFCSAVITLVTGLPPSPECFWKPGRHIHRNTLPGHRPGESGHPE